jgi:hypothetical protein
MTIGARAAAWIAALVLAVGAACGQTAERPDPIRIPSDGTPLRIERIEEIPRQLRAALDRHPGCRLEQSVVRETPIQLFRPAAGAWVIALVPCLGNVIVATQAYQFDRGLGREPTLMAFPVVARDGGFMVSERPGLIAWDGAARTLTATGVNDMCSTQIVRHTYRLDSGGFTLIKAERGTACGAKDWTPLWEAQPWQSP